MKRFAFIDVQNTETTALKVLNFVFDWQKLINYLETRWDCEKIFFYPGIQENDEIRKNLFTNLAGNKSEVIVRIKEYRVYKNQDKISSVPCPNCKIDVVHKVDMGYSMGSFRSASVLPDLRFLQKILFASRLLAQFGIFANVELLYFPRPIAQSICL